MYIVISGLYIKTEGGGIVGESTRQTSSLLGEDNQWTTMMKGVMEYRYKIGVLCLVLGKNAFVVRLVVCIGDNLTNSIYLILLTNVDTKYRLTTQSINININLLFILFHKIIYVTNSSFNFIAKHFKFIVYSVLNS